MNDIERLIDGRAHLESEPHCNGSDREHWRLHLEISVEAAGSGIVRSKHYRTKLVFPSREDCERWHRDYFSLMLRLMHEESVSRAFRAALATQLIDLFEPCGDR